MHCTCRSVLKGVFVSPSSRPSAFPPAFLLPLLEGQSSTFATSAVRSARKRGNPARGVSALRHTGMNTEQKLSVSLKDLPQPRLDPKLRSAVKVDPDHGLWEFFHESRAAIPTPAEVSAHGRGWTVPELRQKSWEDLHKLWWMGVKELNRLSTFDAERDRVGHLFGEYESDNRRAAIVKTQKSIRYALTERWYAWQDARSQAMEDPSINMWADVDKGQAAYVRSKDVPQNGKASDSLPPPANISSGEETRV